jgi:hypothetical protein
MADKKQQDKDNLIDLASERRRFQNRPSQTAPKKGGRQTPYLTGKTSSKTPLQKSPRWYHYIQLIAFLAVLAWFLSRCQAGGF